MNVYFFGDSMYLYGFYTPNFKEDEGDIGLGPSVCVRLSATPFVDCKTRELFELGT